MDAPSIVAIVEGAVIFVIIVLGFVLLYRWRRPSVTADVEEDTAELKTASKSRWEDLLRSYEDGLKQ